MPYSASQIVADACLEAKCPAYTSIAGRKLNMILSELCAYDIDVIRGVTQFVFNPGVTDPLNIGTAGTGPYTLPANWLRSNRDDVFYIILGVKYNMIPMDIAELDALVAQGGLNAYPEYFAVDNSPQANQLNPLMYVWPPPAGAYPVTARYFQQMVDIPTPETSGIIPWFPNQLYLHRRLTGEMMLYTGDDRAGIYLGGENKQDGFLGAAAILKRWLATEGDDQVVKTVGLDRRRFSSGYNKLPNTKTIGWGWIIGWLCASSVLLEGVERCVRLLA